MRREIISAALISILKVYYDAYPEKREELREIESRMEDYIALSEDIGGKVVRVFLNDILKIIPSDACIERHLEITASFLIENLKMKLRELEMEKMRLIGKIISSKGHSMHREWVEITKAKAEGYKRVAKILSNPKEGKDCPSCLMNGRKSKLLSDEESNWFYCPVCNALYIQKDELIFIHRLSELELDMAFDEIFRRNFR